MKKILKFSAEWCLPCKSMASMLSNMEIPLPIEEYDIDEDFEISTRFNIRGVPTIILVDEYGEEIARKTGLMSKEEFLNFCEK